MTQASGTQQTVFVPILRTTAAVLRRGQSLSGLVGHAATPALLRAHRYDASTLEDADYAALSYAGARAVLEPNGDPLRLVLAAEVQAGDIEVDADDPYGQVLVRLDWVGVQALFADESAAAQAVALARIAAAGSTFEQALALPAVESLDAEHDLLWFTPDELDHLPHSP